ncbi:MAG: hypothetical protein HN413_08060 [Chloroflexi bacterium]|jgi:hypothetical protein|nr:hypothetical protein [Chloroflexota bacterium]
MTAQWNTGLPDPWTSEQPITTDLLTDMVQNLLYLYATQRITDGAEVTIATGAVTLASNVGRAVVDTEADAAEDYLDTLGGLGNGQFAWLSPASASRTVILRSGVGNIVLQGYGDEIALRELNQFVWVMRFGNTYLAVGTNVPPRYYLQFTVIPHDSALVTGDDQFVWQIHPELDGYSIVAAHAMVHGVSSSGTPTFQLYHERHAQDILSTLITIDVSEKSSTTAATPPVLNSSYVDLQSGDEIRHDCDVAGTGTTGWTMMYTLEKL